MSGEEYPVGLYRKACGSMGSEGRSKGEITESSAIVGMPPGTCIESGLNLKWEAWYVFGKRMVCGLKVEESARLILQQLTALRNQLNKFYEEFRKLGKHLEQSKTSFDSSFRHLEKLNDRLSGMEALPSVPPSPVQDPPDGSP